MKNNRIKDSFDKLEPDYYADRRMLSSILEESQNVRERNTMKKLSSLPVTAKVLLTVVAALCVMVVTLSVISGRISRKSQQSAENTPGTESSVPAG